MTLTRRDLLVMLAMAGLAPPVVAGAQPAEKVSRLGFLGVATAARFERFLEALWPRAPGARLRYGVDWTDVVRL